MSKINQEKIKICIQIGTIVIALMLPYFYVIGLAYYDGQMSASGLNADIFPLSTAEIYVKSFFAVLIIISDGLRDVVSFFGLDRAHWKQTLGIVFLFFGCVAGLDRFEKSILSHELKSMQSSTEDVGTASRVVLVSAQVLLFLIALIFFLTWGVVLSAKSGVSSMKEEISNYIKAGCIYNKETSWNNCIKLVDKSGIMLHEGLLISKTENEIAIFEKNQILILKLGQDVLVTRTRS